MKLVWMTHLLFLLEQIVYYGNPMSKTIEGLPKERMIETPMEEVQMGMTVVQYDIS